MSFQKFSGGDTPGASQREGATPSCTQHPARPLSGWVLSAGGICLCRL